MKHLLQTVSRAWFETVATPDVQAERIVALLTATRAWLMLPLGQTAFSPAVNAFTSLFPQWAWGLGAAVVAIGVWCATLTPLALHLRVRAMYWAGGHWLLLSVLFIMGEPRALAGWFYLVACLIPLMVIVRLAPTKLPQKTPTKGGDD